MPSQKMFAVGLTVFHHLFFLLISETILSSDESGPMFQATTSSQLSTNWKFHIPDLKVGTLDQLVGLSDDLGKVDAYVEGVTRKCAAYMNDVLEDQKDKVGKPFFHLYCRCSSIFYIRNVVKENVNGPCQAKKTQSYMFKSNVWTVRRDPSTIVWIISCLTSWLLHIATALCCKLFASFLVCWFPALITRASSTVPSWDAALSLDAGQPPNLPTCWPWCCSEPWCWPTVLQDIFI